MVVVVVVVVAGVVVGGRGYFRVVSAIHPESKEAHEKKASNQEVRGQKWGGFKTGTY